MYTEDQQRLSLLAELWYNVHYETWGRYSCFDGFWGGLSDGVAQSGAGTASRPGVKLLSLVQLVINKSNGQFDLIPCVCLYGTWHTQSQ